jgi:hypothetical protein
MMVRETILLGMNDLNWVMLDISHSDEYQGREYDYCSFFYTYKNKLYHAMGNSYIHANVLSFKNYIVF